MRFTLPERQLKQGRPDVAFTAGLLRTAIASMPVLRRIRPATEHSRWAVVLGGGSDNRLQSMTRLICGDDRPKQFCALLDGDTLLAHACRRAERNISTSQILFSVTETHRDYYTPELRDFEEHRMVQPEDRGTAPVILYSALSIEQMDSDALVAILPGDHFYSSESRFDAALESAFEIAAAHPESAVILGVRPDYVETDYSYIELGSYIASTRGEIRRVQGFWGKPRHEAARWVLGKDSVWNTSVMVGHVGALLKMAAREIPDVLDQMSTMPLWSGRETHLEESAYHRVRATDFGRHVLSREAGRLLVLAVPGLGWSDLGCPERVLATVEKSGLKPRWIRAWQQRQDAPFEEAALAAVT